MKEMFNSVDPAGMIPEVELQNLTDSTDVSGGSIVETIVIVSVALCPTTKCTSQCNAYDKPVTL
jgi:hypothetical protein